MVHSIIRRDSTRADTCSVVNTEHTTKLSTQIYDADDKNTTASATNARCVPALTRQHRTTCQGRIKTSHYLMVYFTKPGKRET